MNKYAIVADRLFTGTQWLEQTAVVVDAGRVAAIAPEKELAADIHCYRYPDAVLAPGFIDLQVNGGGGVMFNSETSVRAVEVMLSAHRQHGTTHMLPTLISSTLEHVEEAVEVVRQCVQSSLDGVLGIHLEGPFINPHRNGAHRQDLLSGLDSDSVELLTSLNNVNAKTLVTLAPEIADQDALVRLLASGVKVSIGHSNGSYSEITKALSVGVHGFTHLFNAMTGIQNRDPGCVGAALEDERAWCGIIADGHHVHASNLKLALKVKPPGKVFLVTDAMGTVAGPNSFTLDGQIIEVKDGRCINQQGRLAGAHLGMNEAVRNCVKLLDLPLQEALRMASSYPALALDLDHELGAVAAGYRASFTIMDSKLDVLATVVDGKISDFRGR